MKIFFELFQNYIYLNAVDENLNFFYKIQIRYELFARDASELKTEDADRLARMKLSSFSFMGMQKPTTLAAIPLKIQDTAAKVVGFYTPRDDNKLRVNFYSLLSKMFVSINLYQ